MPEVRVGQTWERTRYGARIQVEVMNRDPFRPSTHWLVRGERGSSVRGDRFDGKQFRFIAGPTS